MKPMKTIHLKQINVEKVKKALKNEDFSTKNSISETTGLSVATCRNILEELLQSGEVHEIELAASTGGRPSRRFVYNENYAYAGLISSRKEGKEISLFCSVINMTGVSVYENLFSFQEVDLETFDKLIEHMTALYPNIRVLALGIPGVIHNGTVGICDFEKLCHIPLVSYLSDKWQRMVVAENDVNCMALGYYHGFQTVQAESLGYICYPKDGISGAGIIVNGRVIRGANDFAGEVSFLPLGINREIQGSVQKNLNYFTELIVNTVISITCIINPEFIVLSGTHFTDVLIESIELRIKDRLPPEHQPHLIFEQDIHDSFLEGLKFLALQKFSCGFEIIENV